MSHFDLTAQDSSFSTIEQILLSSEQAEITTQKYQFVHQFQQNSLENKQLFQALLEDDQNNILFSNQGKNLSYDSTSSLGELENHILISASNKTGSCIIQSKRKRIVKESYTSLIKKVSENKKVSQKQTVKRAPRKSLRKQPSTVQQNFDFQKGFQTILFNKQSEQEKKIISQMTGEKGKERGLFQVFGPIVQVQEYQSYLSLD